MANEKDKEKLVDTELIEKMLREKYGNIHFPGVDVANEDPMVIPLSPRLNMITNGGIPEGSWTLLGGKPKSGKTTLALYFAAKAQREEYGGREVYYLDVERRLKKMNLLGTPGLNLSKFHVIRSTKEKILAAQDFLAIGENILRSKERVVLIVDSYSALCHEDEMAAAVGTPVLGMGSYALLAQFCRQMSQVVPVMKSNIIGITHIMANIGTFGNAAKTVEKGGNAIVYQGDVKLKVKFFSPWRIGADDNSKQIGQKVNWLCEFSALGGAGLEAEGFIRYGVGIDELYELIMCCKEIGLISQSKAWYEVPLLGLKPFHGAENLYKHFVDNPTDKETLLKEFMKTIT